MAEPETAYSTGIQKLFEGARVKKFPKNQIIFYQGDPITNICLVEKGYIKAYTILDSGDTRTLFLLAPGDVFPIAFSVSLNWENYNIKYFYQSLSDVEICLTESNSFRENVENNTKMMNIYLTYMAATNQAIINQLEMMKTKGAINKVAFLLPYLVNKLGQKIGDKTYQLNLKLSHQEIADLTGLTRETTTQQVKKLEKEGIINQKKGTWIIKMEEDEENLGLIG
jgi:CRP/FNR family cyclic AMP-dependent transcriptional regulator